MSVVGMANVGSSEGPVTKESEVLMHMRSKGLTMGSYLEKRLNWVEGVGVSFDILCQWEEGQGAGGLSCSFSVCQALCASSPCLGLGSPKSKH